jgi:photosystem II stability/assembly factor-like uncharacterized protein
VSSNIVFETVARAMCPKRSVALFVLALTISLLSQGCREPKTFDTWEVANSKFRIKVVAQEEGGWVGGARYLFQSASAESNDWHEIMQFRHDDPVLIPREQVHFINDQTAYAFMGWTYAVTTDGGKTWSVWTAERDLPNWQCCNYKLIRDVQLAADGTGKMIFNPVPNRQGEVPELRTRDYGRHWNPM